MMTTPPQACPSTLNNYQENKSTSISQASLQKSLGSCSNNVAKVVTQNAVKTTQPNQPYGQYSTNNIHAYQKPQYLYCYDIREEAEAEEEEAEAAEAEKCFNYHTQTMEEMNEEKFEKLNYVYLINEVDNDDSYDDYYYSHSSQFTSSERGSDNLLVTFDYGYSDSIDEEQLVASLCVDHKVVVDVQETDVGDDGGGGEYATYVINEDEKVIELEWQKQQKLKANNLLNDVAVDMNEDNQLWFVTPETKGFDYNVENVAAAFKVHRMQHALQDSVLSILSGCTETDDENMSLESECAEVAKYMKKGKNLSDKFEYKI